MKPELELIEIEPIIFNDNDFAVEHAASGKGRSERIEQFGEIAIERFFIAALDNDLVPIAKDERTKSVPLGLKNPAAAGR